MATCKECLHWCVCEWADNKESVCSEFKNKADFVEVPCRCSECKFLKIINEGTVYAKCEKQKLTFLLWEADTRKHFCSNGERKGDQSG